MNNTGHISINMFPLMVQARLTLVRREGLEEMVGIVIDIIFKSWLSSVTVHFLCHSPLSCISVSRRSIKFNSARAPHLMSYLALPESSMWAFTESKLALISLAAGLEMMVRPLMQRCCASTAAPLAVGVAVHVHHLANQSLLSQSAPRSQDSLSLGQ